MLKCGRGISHSKWHHSILEQSIRCHKSQNLFGMLTQWYLPISLKQIKLTHKLCTSNLVNIVTNSGKWMTVTLSNSIHLLETHAEPETTIMFWHKDAWQTPLALARLYYSILQHVFNSFVNIRLIGLTLYACCLIGIALPTFTSCMAASVCPGAYGNVSG